MARQPMITRVSRNDLRSRLDSAYYAPAYLSRERRLRALGVQRPTIGQMSSLVTDGTHRTPDYKATGVPFLSATNIKDGSLHFEGHKWVSKADYLQLRAWHCAPVPGDVLVAKSGSIGASAVVGNYAPEFAVFESIAIVRSDQMDSSYLSTFINSQVGQDEIRRQSKGAVIRHLHLEDLRDVEVPEFHEAAQRYIGDRVRQAERLQERGRELRRLATSCIEGLLERLISESQVLNALEGRPANSTLEDAAFDTIILQLSARYLVNRGGRKVRGESNPRTSRSTRIAHQTLISDRLDASYYEPRFLDNEAFLNRSGIPRAAIGAVAEKCNCGATPVNVTYSSTGTGLIRTTDVRPNEFLDGEVWRTRDLVVTSNSATAAIDGDMLYTMSGTIGYAAVVPPTGETYSFSNTIVRARFPEQHGQDPYFTAGFFNCRYGYIQSLRLVSGGIQGHVMPNPFKRLLVPAPHPQVQGVIGRTFRVAETCIRHARALTAAAKLLVEALIEGQVTEPELIEAQQALERGEHSHDLRLLQRLTASGIDREGERPLILDVDALHRLIDQVAAETAGRR